MARHERAYEFATDQGIGNYVVMWVWASLREQAMLEGEPVTCRTIARDLGWPAPLTLALLHQAEDLRLVRRIGARWALGEVDPVETLRLYREWVERPPRVWTQEDLRRWGMTMREEGQE